MKWVILFLAFVFNGLNPAFFEPAVAKSLNLDVRYHYQLSPDPLTTEKIWAFDFDQTNPHLQRWVVHRDSQMEGLTAFPKKNGKFGVLASGILSRVTGYVRPAGPWYQNLNLFPCSHEPNSWFSTQEGSQKAASLAADLWQKVLRDREVNLSLLLTRIVADTPELAKERGEEAFQNWVDKIARDWRAEVQKKVRGEEWKFYQADASEQSVCPRKDHSKSIQPPSLASMMEPVVGPTPAATQLLARAPVRLWNGLFTIRVNVDVGGKNLNGRFLIDSSARKSVISPVFLTNQGIDPGWVAVPGSSPERIRWSDLWNSERGLAPQAYIDSINVSGLNISLHEFLVHETEFFNPPDYVGSCCDGVLGTDFLREYPMEFKSTAPAELRIWPRENFHWSPDVPWVEVSQGKDGDLLSSCDVLPDASSRASSISSTVGSVTSTGSSANLKPPEMRLPWVRWDLGEETYLNIHRPWQKEAKAVRPNSWSVKCESLDVVKAVPANFPVSAWRPSDTGLLSTRIPAASVGMLSLNGEKQTFTFDLPHGRLWFSGGTRTPQGQLKDLAGLKLKYVLNDGDRELRVSEIDPRSKAKSLIQAGLRVGMRITQIDLKPVEDIDLWEVERRLAGSYGNVVSLQWRVGRGLKMAPLKLDSIDKR